VSHEADLINERGTAPGDRRLNAGNGVPIRDPREFPGARLAMAQNRKVLDGAARADIADYLVDFSGERLGAGPTEDVVDAVERR